MARPRKNVEETKIIELASKGMTQNEIAAFCNICVSTLANNYSEAIKKGNALRDGSLRRKQVDVAMGGNPTMLIWLGKQLLGQTDKQEVTGRIAHEHTALIAYTDTELSELRKLAEGALTRADHQRVLQA